MDKKVREEDLIPIIRAEALKEVGQWLTTQECIAKPVGYHTVIIDDKDWNTLNSGKLPKEVEA